MRLCGWCEKRIWPFPWTHLAFRVNADGSRTEYHVRCYQYIQQINAETEKQYTEYSYEQFLMRIDQEKDL